MNNAITQKIVGYRVKAPASEAPVEAFKMHEAVTRPEALLGSTYKIKQPNMDSALYVTINDYEVDGVRHPYEIFLNSKDMAHYQWAIALTRVISAVFRKGGDVSFLAEELKAIFDPAGGGYYRKGQYIPSLVAEIGLVIEKHLKATGVIVEESDPHMEAYIAEKKAAIGEVANGQLCASCNSMSAVLMDGCLTCLNCGASKCG